LFTIRLIFDIPGESRLPEGIEPPYLATPTAEENKMLGTIYVEPVPKRVS